MAADRLYESPFTDTAPQGPEGLFMTTDINNIAVLDTVRANAIPEDTDDVA
jgi:type I restriction enzyme R subunit